MSELSLTNDTRYSGPDRYRMPNMYFLESLHSNQQQASRMAVMLPRYYFEAN